jgi:hypothetical protein
MAMGGDALSRARECMSCRNCWSQPDATEFYVRGLSYMTDKVKVPSQEAAYNLLGVDLLLSDMKVKPVSLRLPVRPESLWCLWSRAQLYVGSGRACPVGPDHLWRDAASRRRRGRPLSWS